MEVLKSKSSNNICNGCKNNIKISDDMLWLGIFGGWNSKVRIKLCRNCVHKAYKEMFNY